MESAFESNALKKKEFTPMELVFRYLKYLPWVILSVVIAVLIAFIYLRYTPNKYSSKGQMIIKVQNPFSSGDERFNSLFFIDAGPNLKNEMVIIKSPSLVQRVVRKLGLQTQYTGIGKVRSTLLYKTSPISLQIIKKNDSTNISLRVTILDSNQYLLNEEVTPRVFGEPLNLKNGVYKIHYNGQPLTN
ncbi:hypothetical protein, partial [Flavihumibacter solisilvae]